MMLALVAKPSTGKSTFFKASTLANVAIASYPFTTIKSQEGVAFVKIDCVDSFFNTQCNPRFGYCLNHKRFVPIKLMDVPGLIEGSHTGAGVGNEFLNDIREADALIHIVDISGSTDSSGELVASLTHYPGKDIEVLDYELNMWYFQILKKGWDKFSRQVRQEKQSIIKVLYSQLSGLKVIYDHLETSIKKLKLNVEDPLSWSEKDLMELASELRQKSKPIIIAANKIDISGSEENLEQLKKDFPKYKIIPCSADSELALRECLKKELITYIPGDNKFEIISKDLNEKQRKALDFIQKEVLDRYGSTGVQELLNAAIFDLLGYITVYPVGLSKLTDQYGRCLPDCFLLPNGSTALDLATTVHQDLGENFIKAIDLKSRLVLGKDYILKNSDVIEIKTKK